MSHKYGGDKCCDDRTIFVRCFHEINGEKLDLIFLTEIIMEFNIEQLNVPGAIGRSKFIK
jgi:hypothetical protein